jgi:hypothetical protein
MCHGGKLLSSCKALGQYAQESRVEFAVVVTTVRLKVEQNQLVIEGWGCDLGAIGLQGA